MSNKALKKITAIALLGVGVTILALVTIYTDSAGQKDYTCYWASGNLLVHRRNPYDAAEIFRLEKLAGARGDTVVVMRNPPNALALALLLGWMPLKIGALVWSMLIVLTAMFSIRTIWAMHGRPPDLHLFGYMFAPLVACVSEGQTAAFVLAGWVLFLRWNKQRPVLAGVSLALMAMKPNVILPFVLVLMVWMITTKRWRLMAAAAIAIAITLAIPMTLDHSLWRHYLPALRDASAETRSMPLFSALGTFVTRTALGRFLPGALAGLWAIWYFWTHRKNWDWNEHGQPILLVSLVVAPYAWFPDEVLALPAILTALFVGSGRSLKSFLVLNGVALAAMLFVGIGVDTPFFFWTPAAWLMWYWLATRRRSARLPDPARSAVAAQ